MCEEKVKVERSIRKDPQIVHIVQMCLFCTAQGPVVSLVAHVPHGLISKTRGYTKFCHSEWVV